MQKKIQKQRGFTIIETMISIALFMIIILAGMGALLNANSIHRKSQDMRSIMDNLSFIMEDMSRNLRTGYNYRCIVGAVFTNIEQPQSCPTEGGRAIAFEEGNADPTSPVPTDQWVYSLESTDGINFNIYKSTDGGASWTRLNPEEVKLSNGSGFLVSGAEPPPGDSEQPFVTILLEGTITYKNIVSPFSLQTSVSQRLIDII